jgi:hypothetical protein
VIQGRSRWILGTISLVLYLGHAATHIGNGEAGNLLWVCNVGALGIGVGYLLGSPLIVGVGTLWLLIGTPIWIYDCVARGAILWTSPLVHVGCLALGGYGTIRVGIPRGTGWKASLGLLCLAGAARVLTPPDLNVNLAFGVWTGWENVIRSHLLFAGGIYLICVGVFLGAEMRLGRKDDPSGSG